MKFNEFKLSKSILEAIAYMGFEEATPIQESTIPQIINGKDLIACAQTGTGKTAAFLLPILNKLSNSINSGINTLIIVPTRELAIQIDQEIQGFAFTLSVSSIPVYGGGDGADWGQQKIALTQGADIIVATPGRLIAHLNMDYVKFDNVKHLILDEADRMLDMGFNEDIEKITSYLKTKPQTLMFSATMPPNIRKLAKQILKDPFEINIAMSKPAEGVLQAAYVIYDTQKSDLIINLISNQPDYKSILIFSSTKKKVFEIVRSLTKNNEKVEGISSDLEQAERGKVLLRFKSKETRILVATDVLSRGIDIKNINLVINFDVPNDAEDYVHRVGRTARVDATGVALTLINEDDMYKFHQIEKLIEQEIIKIPLPKDIGTGPEWKIISKPRRINYRTKRRN